MADASSSRGVSVMGRKSATTSELVDQSGRPALREELGARGGVRGGSGGPRRRERPAYGLHVLQGRPCVAARPREEQPPLTWERGADVSHGGVRIGLGRKQQGEDWIRLTVRDQGPLGCPGEDQFPDYLASHDPRGSHRRRKADSSRRRALGLRGAGSGDAHATVVVVAVLVVLVFGRDRPALGLRPDRSDNGQILPGIILSFQQRWRGLLAGSPWGVQGDLGCADRGLLSLDLL